MGSNDNSNNSGNQNQNGVKHKKIALKFEVSGHHYRKKLDLLPVPVANTMCQRFTTEILPLYVKMDPNALNNDVPNGATAVTDVHGNEYYLYDIGMKQYMQHRMGSVTVSKNDEQTMYTVVNWNMEGVESDRTASFCGIEGTANRMAWHDKQVRQRAKPLKTWSTKNASNNMLLSCDTLTVAHDLSGFDFPYNGCTISICDPDKKRQPLSVSVSKEKEENQEAKEKVELIFNTYQDLMGYCIKKAKKTAPTQKDKQDLDKAQEAGIAMQQRLAEMAEDDPLRLDLERYLINILPSQDNDDSDN